MKTLKFFFIALSLLLSSAAYSQQFNVLPQVMIMGKPYYRYQVKDGDSLYGICKELGWEQALVTSLNPSTKSSVKKGEFIYYPIESGQAAQEGNPTEIRHKIMSGETVYGIAKQYNVSTEEIYAANPGTEYGIKEGAELIIPTRRTADKDGYIKHKIQADETLYGTAKRYNTSISQILHDNPGVSDTNFQAGKIIRVLPDSNNKNLVKETTTVNRLISVSNYKVKKNQTWADVAKKTKVDVNLLKDANPGVTELRKDLVLVVPQTVSVTLEREVAVTDPRESTSEGRTEIYEEVQQQLEEETKLKEVRAAIILENYTSVKDMEFSRGFIQAVDEMKHSPFKISLKIVDASQANLLGDLASFQPTIIFTTMEKNLPDAITDFGRDKDCWIVNVFDTRDEKYIINPKVVQVLDPSEQFNDAIAGFIPERFAGWNLIVAGTPEQNDAISQIVIGKMDPLKETTVSLEDLKTAKIDPYDKYLIYATPTKKADVEKLLDNVIALKEQYPQAEIAVFGRPSWVALSGMTEKLGKAGTYLPSRFFFDPELSDSRDFINDYKKLYGHTPVKSFPVYAVAGYDVANYFLPELYATRGDLSKAFNDGTKEGLQNKIYLENPDNASGLINTLVYMLKYNTFGNVDKIEIK